MYRTLAIPISAGMIMIGVALAVPAAETSAGAALTAVRDARLTLSEIRTLGEVGGIQLIPIETIDAVEAERLQQELENRKADVGELQAAIGSNEELMERIRAKDPDFSIASIVAADLKDGQLIIYTLAQGGSN